MARTGLVLWFEEADWRDKKLLGGKGASLAQMTQIGLPVPPGFIITTEACRKFYSSRKAEMDELERQLRGNPPPAVRDEIIKKIWALIDQCDLPAGLMEDVREHMQELERRTGKKFGAADGIPLLVSVRSGAALSMPGMMDTVLNLGLNDNSVQALAKATNNEWFAYDAYRRFIQMFARIVLALDEKPFNDAFDRKSEQFAREAETTYKDELDAIRKLYPEYTPRLDAQPPKDIAPRLWARSLELIKELVGEYKDLVRKMWGEFPQDPYVQLELAIRAVFRSWMNPRAIFYRIANNITPDMADCTAVNVVTMVFGNMGWDSGTGVYFTRDQSTGEDRPYGEFLPNAQGEDVVAGIRTPLGLDELKKRMPEVYNQLIEAGKKLEQVNKDVMDIEFTVERGKLYFLQNRPAKMTPLARVRSAVEMVKEGLLTKEEALLKVDPEQVRRLLYPTIDPKVKATPIAKGLPASPGAASGQVVFNPDDAVEWAKQGKKVILVRVETKPDDVHGFYAAQGVLTSRGGMTSHAAIVARAIGKPAVVGAEAIKIDYDSKTFTVNGVTVKEGDWVTIDGNSGSVYLGELPTVTPELGGWLDELLKWADEERRLGVRANADVPEDAMMARKFGAEGIGLLRIERMFRKPERLEALRRVILAADDKEREAHMKELADMIKPDFKEMLDIMDGKPVVIRLIDPPLHEFLPSSEELLAQIYDLREQREKAQASGDAAKVKELDQKIAELQGLYNRVKALQEANPMMGHRGVRVGVTYPVIYYYLTRAMAEAAAELIKEGKRPVLEIMVPQVSDVNEIRFVKNNAILPALSDVEKEYGVKLNVKIGTMIETVRAALTASEIAKEVDFFSFGTNDLTQATFSFSRDDVENKFMNQYLEKGILANDPFDTVDVKGVGRLVEIATKEGKEANPKLEVGVCGEHGGDPASINFFHGAGVDYVSASPFRVPVARLAAAQAAVKEKLGIRGAVGE
ncbi:Pyruvate, phosphate dikinase (PPDK) [Acidilobus saccharovorans 345-15]|uniref:pyruvate, phosphate dikinase n=1 Tax=Acidilobus saccharovorans (strain DSM 16705 / JCM 18335 / VKM B-2471 / 345-15) TaxID=666510 RepID=D9Q1F7_ACIS3|nr:pyruvate, phosphate dikinase [Acidilobus saccharovorans]ADL19145.1 Pyruvate, phosphate dikinase (PPDK) [Acidilobus saccharovorans 345-15]